MLTILGKKLEAITVVHGPPTYANAAAPCYTDALWALRWKVAIGPFMPDTIQRGNAPKDADIVKQGYGEKTDPKVRRRTNQRRRTKSSLVWFL